MKVKSKSWLRDILNQWIPYTPVCLMKDGECMCRNCALENFDSIEVQSSLFTEDDDWTVVDVFINYEDENMYCCQCNEKIPSEYGGDE